LTPPSDVFVANSIHPTGIPTSIVSTLVPQTPIHPRGLPSLVPTGIIIVIESASRHPAWRTPFAIIATSTNCRVYEIFIVTHFRLFSLVYDRP
jgi:hypothetical protein